MNKKFSLFVLIILAILIIWTISKKLNPKQNELEVDIPTASLNQNEEPDSKKISPILSSDKKSIRSNGDILLSIDSGDIWQYFQDPKQGLCDKSNIENTGTRKAFCTDKNAFRKSASFSKIYASKSRGKIAFEIITTELEPDTVVGIFYPNNEKYKVHFLTNYYLGNQFISFSPTDKNLTYKTKCFENKCTFAIKDSATLETLFSFSDALDEQPNREFVRWLDDNSLEYQENGTLKKTSF